MKRIFDIFFSFFGLIITFPIIIVSLFLVWNEDKYLPFYMAKRVGKNGKNFNMFKIRTMIINADKSGVDSTSSNDKRITKIGRIIRKYKIDELTQFLNIIIGDMSFVGPRPNDLRDTKIYTKVERKLLKIKPGLTDFASIVFSDESDILSINCNPDITYNQLIRPSKSSLALFYIKKRGFLIDLLIIFLTATNIFFRKKTLKMLSFLLKTLNAPKNLVEVSSREFPLIPSPPPGSDKIVESR